MKAAILCLLVALVATLAMIPAALASPDGGPGAIAADVEPPPPVSVPAAPTPPDDADVIKDAFGDVVSGDGRARAIVVILLIGVVYCLRRWAKAPLPWVGWRILPAWFGTDRGGVVLTLVLGFAGAIAHALYADASVDLNLFEAALMVAITAAGGYATVRRMLWPPDQRPDESPPIGDFTRPT